MGRGETMDHIEEGRREGRKNDGWAEQRKKWGNEQGEERRKRGKGHASAAELEGALP
jgi:hypothetical protein